MAHDPAIQLTADQMTYSNNQARELRKRVAKIEAELKGIAERLITLEAKA